MEENRIIKGEDSGESLKNTSNSEVEVKIKLYIEKKEGFYRLRKILVKVVKDKALKNKHFITNFL